MRVVLVSQNVTSGVLTFRKDLIKFLVEKGHEVYALANDYDEETKLLVESMGVQPVDYYLSGAGVNPLEDIRSIYDLYRKISQIKPDVVFSFFVKASLYGTLAAAFAKVPKRIAMLEGLGFVYTNTENQSKYKKKAIKLIHGGLASVCYYFADKVLFLNRDDPVDLLKNSFAKKSKFEVVGPIGLNLSDYPYSAVKAGGKVVFIFVARLIVEKGIFEFLNAARNIKESYSDVEFVVLGSIDKKNPTGIRFEELKKYIEEEVVVYPGYVKDINSWVKSSHVFVLPSYYREGVPRAIQEAMAIGRAIITTDSPGCRETVVDGVNGFLVPPRKTEYLIKAMESFINNKDMIVTMGEASHRIAKKRFDSEKIIPRLAEMLVGRVPSE